MRRIIFGILAICGTVLAHPMGNFSVSHYAKFHVGSQETKLDYVLDLAEIPTFQLLQEWGLTAEAPRAQLEAHAAIQARKWAQNLQISSAADRVHPTVEGSELAIQDGAGNMPVMRITAHLTFAAAQGKLNYEDTNYADRAGWKEIVVENSHDVRLASNVPAMPDRSKGLTAYPQDATVAPPQEVSASIEWTAVAAAKEPAPAAETGTRDAALGQSLKSQPARIDAGTKVPQNQTASAVGASAPASVPTTSSRPPGTNADMVSRDGYISGLLKRKDLPWPVLLLGLLFAFGWGASHALSPGHGKTMVAAYLVGARGTPKHALILGATVTFTHTISVFLLGFVTLFLSQYILPHQLYPILGAISGLSIVWIGGSLLQKRWSRLRRHSHAHDHHHGHAHSHDHDHVHEHAHELVHAHAGHDHGHAHVHHHHGHDHHHAHDHHHHDHDHAHGHDHEHHHGPGGHTHMPEGDVTIGSLIALGASGGLVPCPSGLVLLLSSIAVGRVALGLSLLVAFSAGLAVVLMAIGLIVLYAKNLLPDKERAEHHPAFQWIPIASAAVIVVLGLLVTGVSLGFVNLGGLVV